MRPNGWSTGRHVALRLVPRAPLPGIQLDQPLAVPVGRVRAIDESLDGKSHDLPKELLERPVGAGDLRGRTTERPPTGRHSSWSSNGFVGLRLVASGNNGVPRQSISGGRHLVLEAFSCSDALQEHRIVFELSVPPAADNPSDAVREAISLLAAGLESQDAATELTHWRLTKYYRFLGTCRAATMPSPEFHAITAGTERAAASVSSSCSLLVRQIDSGR